MMFSKHSSKLLLIASMSITTALFYGCSDDAPTTPEVDSAGYDWTKHVPFQSDYMADFLPISDQFAPEPIEVGPLRIDESSGLCTSLNNPGMLWTHEDSGNLAMIYLIDGETADIVCRYRVVGAANQDWEDIEIVRDPQTGRPYLYISDTGDNAERRTTMSIYKFEEPHYTPADYGQTRDIDGSTLSRFNLTYPDGSHDVEGMCVDPDTEDIYLVTKRDAVSKVYVMPAPHQTTEVNRTYFVGDLGFRETSAATLDLSGERLIIRNRQNLFYWERQPTESIAEMMARTPVRLPYVGEAQGEAVCFDLEGNYWTSSERSGLPQYPPLYKYVKN